MPEMSSIPLPAAHALRKLGRDLAVARRKRGISTEDMAARLFVSRSTLWRMERGDPTVALGTLATAAFVLQLHDRLANLAAPATDALALSLEEQRLPKRIRRARA
jgi:transcriptional regulator with XRE-family HTH domain